MKFKQKASVAFKEEKSADKVVFGGYVISGFKANPKDFPNLPLSVDVLEAINDKLDNAIAAANTGNHVSVAELAPIVEEWNENFEQMADYVSAVANGSEAVIKKANYNPTKSESSPAQLLPAPEGFRAMINDKKGAVSLKSKKAIAGGRMNVFYLTPEGVDVVFNGNVMQVTIDGKTVYILVCPRKEVDIYNLPKNQLFTAGMYAVNTAGSGVAATQEVTPQ